MFNCSDSFAKINSCSVLYIVFTPLYLLLLLLVPFTVSCRTVSTMPDALEMSRVMRKPAFCICKNKDADQRTCFRYVDSTHPLLSKSKISSIKTSPMAAQPGLCRTWSEIPKTGFLMTRLKYDCTTRVCPSALLRRP